MTHFITPQAEPGPYAVEYYTDGCDEILAIQAVETGQELARIGFWSDFNPIDNARRESTFRLMAAAPQLRDALTQLLASLDYSHINEELAAAIANARHALGTAHGQEFATEESFLIPTRLTDG